MAVASLVLGILSLACGVFGIGFRLGGIVLAVIGIVLSSKSTENDKASMARAGKTCSIIGLILCAAMLLFSSILLGFFSSFLGSGILDSISKLMNSFM